MGERKKKEEKIGTEKERKGRREKTEVRGEKSRIIKLR